MRIIRYDRPLWSHNEYQVWANTLAKEFGGDEHPRVEQALHVAVASYRRSTWTAGYRLHSKVRDGSLESVVCAQRGGGLTWHGPGQLIVYPLVRLHPNQRSVRIWTECFACTAIEFIHKLGCDSTLATYDSKRPGIWVKNQKVASIGFSLQKGVLRGGLSINVCNNLSELDAYNACGLSQSDFTCVRDLLDDGGEGVTALHQKHYNALFHSFVSNVEKRFWPKLKRSGIR